MSITLVSTEELPKYIYNAIKPTQLSYIMHEYVPILSSLQLKFTTAVDVAHAYAAVDG